MPRAVRRALFAIVVLLAAALSPALAQERALVGQVAAEERALVVRGGGERRPLVEGEFLFEGDRVLSGAPDSGLHMVFADRSTLTLGPDSEVVIARYRAGSGGLRLEAAIELVAGILRITLEESGGRAPFEVRSPAALTSARATDWIVEASPERSAVFVVEGRVAVSAPESGSIVLTPGFGSEILAGRAPGRPTRWDEARVQALLERSRIPTDLEEPHQVIQ